MKKLPFFLAFSLALSLVALFAYLLAEMKSTSPPAAPGAREPVAPRARQSLAKVEGAELPFGPPTALNPFEKPPRKRYEGKFYRWNLQEVPEGWDPEVAARIHEFLEAMEYDDLNGWETQKRLERARRELPEYLARLGPEALPTLGKILNVEPDFVARRFVFRGIGQLGPRSELATWILRGFYRARYHDPGGVSEMGRLIEAMGFLKNETSFELLSRQARNIEPGHDAYRDKFVVALGEHPRRLDAVDVFADGLDDDSFSVRNMSAQAFGKVRAAETLDVLYQAFEREAFERKNGIWVRQTILGSIGKIGEVESIPFLEARAREAPERGVRLSAAKAIQRIYEQTGDSYAHGLLRELAATEPDPRIRARIRGWYESL
ncbi:MAG: HEAT repeat domain-containing protein [Planctomycetota bacterium]|nr:HEAT repeat domain-containing protein [Planctomycetota bacterium]